MLRDCKYRLPCAWCDKYDRECYAVQYEVAKMNSEPERIPVPKEIGEHCDHNWRDIYISNYIEGKKYALCICENCKEVKLFQVVDHNA